MPAHEQEEDKKRPKPPAKKVEASYEGLAAAWEKKGRLRRKCLTSKSLLEWLAPNRVGVVTMHMLKLNVPVILSLLKIYLPQAPKPKTCNLDLLKAEARCMET